MNVESHWKTSTRSPLPASRRRPRSAVTLTGVIAVCLFDFIQRCQVFQFSRICYKLLPVGIQKPDMPLVPAVGSAADFSAPKINCVKYAVILHYCVFCKSEHADN